MSDQNNESQVSTNAEPSANMESQQTQTGAVGNSAEDTLSEYKALIEQIKAQNQALIEQNKSLQNQFGILIRNGASVGHNDSNTDSEHLEPTKPEKYVSLAELGSEIGKRDYKSHNSLKE